MQLVTGAGRVVAGRYELLDPAGHGAMGTVWRARDLRLDRVVAVKEVRLPGPMTTRDRSVLRERSLREARVAARLTHPGVVTVHDVIEAEGSPWIIMELVPSRSLAQVLAKDGPLSPARVAAMGVTLLGALGSAHAAGVVHRDVKPGNILVTQEGRVVLTDFGIATLQGDPRLTQAGMVMGTPGFCAPERIRGEPASPASDLWSLGATLYAAVEGRAPFEGQGSAMAVLANIVHGDPPPAKRAGRLEPVIRALMKRDPAARPDAAGARCLLTAACSGHDAETSASAQPGDTTQATVGATGEAGNGANEVGAGAARAAVDDTEAGATSAGATEAGADETGPDETGPDETGADETRAGDGGNGATADGGADQPGTWGGGSAPGGTLPLPLYLPRDNAAFAGWPSAATLATAVTGSPTPPSPVAPQPSPTAPVTARTPVASDAMLASSASAASGASQGPGGQSRRRGRHRRALLFGGGGGGAAVMAIVMIALAVSNAAWPPGCGGRPRVAQSRRSWRSPPDITG